MRIRELRAELPNWHWEAKRYGFGWYYVGTLGERRVEIRAFACLVSEDDAVTQWRVIEGATSASYSSWWIDNA